MPALEKAASVVLVPMFVLLDSLTNQVDVDVDLATLWQARGGGHDRFRKS